MGKLRAAAHLFDRDPDTIPYCRCGLPRHHPIHRCPQCNGHRWIYLDATDPRTAAAGDVSETHPSGVTRLPCPTCNPSAAPAAPDAPNDQGVFEIDAYPPAPPPQRSPYGGETP
jgi:hypothetical protein